MGSLRRVWLLAAATALGCSSSTASPRAQAVVFIDTDVPVTGQVPGRPDLSAAAAIDVVRIEPTDSTGAPTGSPHDVVASDPLDWPISFGVLAGSAIAHFRVRAYASAVVTDPDDVGQASAVIDRLVDVPVPASGVGAVGVLLAGDCFGVKSSLLDHTTCIDATRPAGAASDGVVPLGSTTAPSTQVGTWPKAIAQPCKGTPPTGSVCIPGGVTFLGDLRLAGTQDGINNYSSVPLLPVALEPFFLDVTEFTVGRFNTIANQIASQNPLPLMQNAQGSTFNVACQWLGAGDSSHDTMPLNCLPARTAAQACQLKGGQLPTEAQWEHAARGRGQGRAYTWGNAAPACCSANVNFLLVGSAFEGDLSQCKSPGPVPVGSFKSDACGGINDVSRDGILDLAGNVSEWVADQYQLYDSPCWGSGVPLDPMCPLQAGMNNVVRGSDFSGDVGNPVEGMAAVRGVGLTDPGVGFRCAYPDVAP